MSKTNIVSRDCPFSGSVLVGPRGRGPGLVLLHGSEGGMQGWNATEAMFWAAHGFHALALSSWANDLRDIELHRTFDAIGWLSKQRFVTDGRVGVIGGSRGGEQALLIGALSGSIGDELPVPAVVVAHSPSDKIVCGNPEFEEPAWRFCNNNDIVKTGTKIEIEKYPGPIFITHGKQFEFPYWNWKQTARIERRLKKAGRKCQVHYWKDRKLEPSAHRLRRLKAAGHQCEIHFFDDQGHILRNRALDCRNALLLNFLKHNLG